MGRLKMRFTVAILRLVPLVRSMARLLDRHDVPVSEYGKRERGGKIKSPPSAVRRPPSAGIDAAISWSKLEARCRPGRNESTKLPDSCSALQQISNRSSSPAPLTPPDLKPLFLSRSAHITTFDGGKSWNCATHTCPTLLIYHLQTSASSSLTWILSAAVP